MVIDCSARRKRRSPTTEGDPMRRSFVLALLNYKRLSVTRTVSVR
jgi:hypothetical protein